jgi:hypothetical protein
MPTRAPRSVKTFDQLLETYYGRLSPTALPTIDDVVADYYGKPHVPRRARGSSTRMTLGVGLDDGELLAQPQSRRRTDSRAVQASIEPGGAAFDEYVVPSRADSGRDGAAYVLSRDTVVAARLVNPPEPVSAAQERTVDLLHPLAIADAPPPAPAQAQPAAPPPSLSRAARTPDREAAPGSEPPYNRPTVDDADFAADMQAILSGKKVYDPASGQTVDRDRLRDTQLAEARAAKDRSPLDSGESPAPEVRQDAAIFERIAKSMQYANAYDLGTVELESRFDDFDRIAELEEKARQKPRTKPPRPATPATPAAAPAGSQHADSADFIEDLDAIREKRGTATPAADAPVADLATATESTVALPLGVDQDAACSPSALKLPLSESHAALSRPFYDAGEHALAGGDLYPDLLRVGVSPGLAFSYGGLMAMADLYASVDQMMATDLRELATVKALVDRSTEFYRTHKTTPALDVTNKEWDDATGGRYLRLAEDNYEHFSPNTIFTDAIARAANRHGDNKSAWEAHHRLAIEEARKLIASSGASSPFQEWPLTINAFGDHFLTDAFASGHLINKEVMIAYFKNAFFSGSSLKPAAEAFFKRVAEKAFVGDVRSKFSVLETADYPVCAHGWCLKWHPNIDSTNTFYKLLLAAAVEEPEKVANFAVKALHDKLNREGIEVSNGAGDPPWTLTGDNYLNATSLAIMRRAVQRSVDDINDGAGAAADLGPTFARVWRFVPQPTPASRQKIASLVAEYTNPTSVLLSDAAAQIIREQVDSLIKVLLDQKKLKRA